MSRKAWKPNNISYLENNWGTVSIDEMARHLGRSRKSIESKAYKMNLGNMTNNVPGIPLKDLAEIVGKNYHDIRKTWKNNGLNIRKCGNSIAYVTEKDLFKFMKEHPNLWDARQCDKYYFIGQKWFDKILQDERNGNHAKRYHKWTAEEKARFIYMREQKAMYFREIAEVFGVSTRFASKQYWKWKRQEGNCNEKS